MKVYLFLFFLDILVSRCLTGGVTHELVFDISINSCESPDSGNVTVIVVGTVSQLSRCIGVKMSDRRCDT